MALVGGFPYISSAQNKTLTIVRGTHFIPEAQEIAKQQAEEFGKQAGVKVNADFLNWPDLQPRLVLLYRLVVWMLLNFGQFRITCMLTISST